MNKLKGLYVNVVLNIRQGRGFEGVRSSTYVTANFNGRIMESEKVDIHSAAFFNTEMIWETEKKLLRRARGAYTCVRIEAYTAECKLIGFAMIWLRTAKVLNDDEELNYFWTRLVNVPSEFKRGVPELNVALSIRESKNAKLNAIETILEQPPFLVPVKYTTKGYLQLGNDDDNLEHFLLKVCVKNVTGLDIMLCPDFVPLRDSKDFHLVFEMFETEIKTRQFTEILQKFEILNEDVVYNLRTTYDYLKLYYDQFPMMSISFYNKTWLLGCAKVEMDRMNWLQKKVPIVMEQETIFDSYLPRLMGKDTERIASIYVECTLTKKEEAKPSVTPKKRDLTPNNLRQKRVPRSASASAISSQKPVNSVTPRNVRSTPTSPVTSTRQLASPRKKKIQPLLLGSPRSAKPRCSKAKSAMRTIKIISPLQSLSTFKLDLNQHLEGDSNYLYKSYEADIATTPVVYCESYRQFEAKVMLEFLKFKQPINAQTISLVFFHPKEKTRKKYKAMLDPELGATVPFQNVICRMIFMAVAGSENNILSCVGPTIQLFDADSKEAISKQANILFKVSNKPRKCVIELFAVDGNRICNAQMSLTINEYPLTAKLEQTKHDLLPIILDDSCIVQNLQRLDEWSELRKFRLEADLLEERRNRTMKMYADWLEYINEKELPVHCMVHKLKVIAKSITEDLRSVDLKQNVEPGPQNDILNYHCILRQYKNVMDQLSIKSHEIIDEADKLDSSLQRMCHMLAQFEVMFKTDNGNQLPYDKLHTLVTDLKCLDSKYTEVQRDKLYFKEEYERAVRETHKLKMECHEALVNKIVTNKNELSFFNYDNFVSYSIDNSNPTVSHDRLKVQQTDSNEQNLHIVESKTNIETLE